MLTCAFCGREAERKNILSMKEGLEPQFIKVLFEQVPDEELFDMENSTAACQDCKAGIDVAFRMGRILQPLEVEEDDWDKIIDPIRQVLDGKVESYKNLEPVDRAVLVALFMWAIFEKHDEQLS